MQKSYKELVLYVGGFSTQLRDDLWLKKNMSHDIGQNSLTPWDEQNSLTP